jgi:hypothetical protein
MITAIHRKEGGGHPRAAVGLGLRFKGFVENASGKSLLPRIRSVSDFLPSELPAERLITAAGAPYSRFLSECSHCLIPRSGIDRQLLFLLVPP